MSPNQSTRDLQFAQILDEKFNASVPNEDYSILRALKAIHNGENTRHVALLDNTTCPSFPLSGYLNARGISVEVIQDPLHELVSWDAAFGAGSSAGLFIDFNAGARTDKGQLVPRLITGSMKFLYEGTNFLVYKASWHQPFRGQVSLFDFVFDEPGGTRPSAKKDGEASAVTPTETAGHKLISDVYRWAGALKDEMWVFQDGLWAKDKALWSAIRDATWDEIVLEREFLEGLRRDTRTFFENRKIYKDLGVVWKRGLLLLGPPGNGKTESIKVLMKESGQAALYVKSFTTPDGPELGVRRIFDHARANAPCILVIEDLDSLVTSDVRSFFLNELDGIGQNEGILTIATTNHPERIDDAILNRPSRFDVKYNFALPTEELRSIYALKWIRKITALTAGDLERGEPIVKFAKSETQLAEDVAKETEGWSFAFLKELFVSFLLRIAHDKARALSSGIQLPSLSTPSSPVDTILMSQIKALSSQIIPSKPSDGAEDQAEALKGMGTGVGMQSLNTMMRRKVIQASAACSNAMPAVHSGTNF